MIEAKGKGLKVIVVDPRYTRTAQEADIWLQIRPGTDEALAMGMIRHIIEKDLCDHPFVREWCLGFEEIKMSVKDFTPERVEDSTWVYKDPT